MVGKCTPKLKDYGRTPYKRRKNAWKESVLESRLDDFIILKDWLKAEKIEFENHGYFIIVKNMIIEFDLKVAFSAGRKKYQYNIEAIKKRVQKN